MDEQNHIHLICIDLFKVRTMPAKNPPPILEPPGRERSGLRGGNASASGEGTVQPPGREWFGLPGGNGSASGAGTVRPPGRHSSWLEKVV